LSDHSQQDRQAFGTDIGEVRHEPQATPRQLLAYVAALASAPFLLLIGTALWMMSPAYRNHAQYAYIAGTGYGMRLHDSGCEVVVYGDSTALVGVVPGVIQARSGLKTCNIAEIAGVQKLNGLMVLDTYLRRNPRPRFLVFLYAPENLDEATRWTEVSSFEGIFFRLQMRPDWAFWKAVAKDPSDMMVDLELGFRTGVQWLFSRQGSKVQVREQNLGRVPEPGDPLTHCPANLPERSPDAAWLGHLRQTYGVDGTRVLIDVTPVPPCDPTRPFYAARLSPGLVDNRIDTLPMAMYTNSGRLHTNDAGADAISERIAAQIVQIQKGAL
jgi:hypothetical protein